MKDIVCVLLLASVNGVIWGSDGLSYPQNNNNNKALIEAAGKGAVDQVDRLISAGATVKVTLAGHMNSREIVSVNDNGETALIAAAKGLKHGADGKDFVAVIKALSRITGKSSNQPSVFEDWFMLQNSHKRKLFVSWKDKSGLTALQYAAMAGNEDVVQLLLAHGAGSESYSDANMSAARLLHNCFPRDANVNTDSLANAALKAEENGHTELARRLRATIELILAARKHDFELVKRLLKKGAFVNARDDVHAYPLYMLFTDGYPDRSGYKKYEILNMLLRYGYTGNFYDKDLLNFTVLLREAVLKGDFDAAQKAITMCAYVDAGYYDGKTVLDVAQANNHQDIVKLLVASGAKDWPVFNHRGKLAIASGASFAIWYALRSDYSRKLAAERIAHPELSKRELEQNALKKCLILKNRTTRKWVSRVLAGIGAVAGVASFAGYVRHKHLTDSWRELREDVAAAA